eukprot:XP_014774533.1 PREDICTED: uncharacterized protein LOC106872165 [Octopus bimaculoides]
MLFGLRNTANTFQRLITEVLRGLDFVFAYIDDLLITTPTEEQHFLHLEQLFTGLSQHGVIIIATKCLFGAPSITFLGQVIDKDRIHLVKEIVQKLFFLSPNCYVIEKTKQNNEAVSLNSVVLRAFNYIMGKLSRVTVLAHPVPEVPLLALMVDASDRDIKVLQQFVHNEAKPLDFYFFQYACLKQSLQKQTVTQIADTSNVEKDYTD